MSVIWKRPDGLQNANPENFRKVQLSNGDTIWVYKEELHDNEMQLNHHNWYPFQLGGDWSREEETKLLNRYVNMLDAPDESWESALMHIYDDNMDPQGRRNIKEVAKSQFKWIESLEKDIKGDRWEIDIIKTTLKDIKNRLQKFFLI